MKTLLITGAGGRIGKILRPHLRQRYRLRLLDTQPIETITSAEEGIVGDLRDPVTLQQAVQGIDGILHLACVHGTELDFEDTLDVNYRATLALLEAARQAAVGRFIFASSHHVVGQYRADDLPGDDASPAPDSYYGLSKAFGEAACAMYAQRYGIGTLSIRIGNADPSVIDARRRRLWISARDLAQLIDIGMAHEQLEHAIVYGISRSPDPMFKNTSAQKLGYCPQDNAEDFIDPKFINFEAMPEAEGPDYVGGGYAGSQLK